MKNKCILLVKNRLISQFGINERKYEHGKSKASKRFMLPFMIIIMMVFAAYCGGYAYGLHYLDAADLIPAYAFLLCTVVTLFLTIFKTPGELFGYQDFDFLMSIPVKTTTIIASRFITLYVWNTVVAFVIMLPMGLIYSIYINPGIMFYPLWFISMFVVSFIPTTIAVVIGALIGGVSSKLKNQRLMSGILQVTLVAAILIIPYFAVSSDSFTAGEFNLEFIKNVLLLVLDKFGDLYPAAGIFENIVIHYSLADFCLFILLSLGWYLLFVKILSLKYKKINTALFAYHTSAAYDLHSLKQSNVLLTLYSKELKQWYSCPVYLTNTTVGAIMALLLSFAFLAFGPAKIVELGKGMFDEATVNSAIVYMITTCLGMCCTTMASISLEGKRVWLLQSLPVTMTNIIKSKILVNLTITIPCGLICSTLYIATVHIGIAEGILSYLLPIAFSLFSAVFGLWLNLKAPDYSWESEAIVVKQNATALTGMLLTPFVSLVVMAISIFSKIPSIMLAVAVTALLTLLIIFLYRSIINKYNKVPL